MKSILVLALCGAAMGASAQVTTPSACSVMSLGALAPLNGFIPSPNDAWHQNIANAPVDPASGPVMTDLSGGGLYANFSIPYVVVDSSTTPLQPITVTDYASQSDITLLPIPANMPVEGSPADCDTDYSSTGDAHAIILDRATCVDYEIAQADHCATTTPNWTGTQTSIWDFTENEQRPITWTSVDAAGLSVFEGLVRYDEIVAGVIPHAIRFTVSLTKNDGNGGYFVPPATHAAGNNWGTAAIMGMRMRLRADFDISGYSPTNQIILTAMKQYGLILADNGRTGFIQGTPDPRWDSNDLLNLGSVMLGGNFDIVDPAGSGYYLATSNDYSPGVAPMYPAGNVMDPSNYPSGNAPTNSLAASATSITAGQSVTLTPTSSGASYNFIDNAGFLRGPITVSPTTTTTYTLYSNNAYGSTASNPVTVTVGTAASSSSSSSSSPYKSRTTPTLTLAPVPTQTFGAAPFTVSATSNSPGAMTFSVVSGDAIISGQTVTLTGTGTVELSVRQAPSGSYRGATATTTFSINPEPPAISFAIANEPYPSNAASLAASSNSTGTVTYSVVSGPAVVSGNQLTLTGTGQVTVLATQAARGNFASGAATASFTAIGPPSRVLGPPAR